MFPQQLLEKLFVNLVSADWWASELPSYLVFGLIVGWVVRHAEKRIEDQRFRKEREPFERWRLRIEGYGDPDQNLYYEDVRRYLSSDFELFRFLKGVCTTFCDLKTKTLADARGTWFFVDEAARVFSVDFRLIPDGQIDRWKREMPEGRAAARPAAE